MKTIASYNVKGGVGKTSAAVNLAYLSAQDGYRTLLWDLDPQGAATFLFRIRPKVKGGSRKLVGGSRSGSGETPVRNQLFTPENSNRDLGVSYVEHDDH